MLQAALQAVSEWWPWLIAAIFIVNLIIWFCLIRGGRQFKKKLSAYLSSIVRPFTRQSDNDPTVSVDEQIDAFIADIRDVLQSPRDEEEAGKLYHRLTTKDEARDYLKLHRFELWYNIARTLIEIYPLLGIVGTVIAIWAGLSASGTSEPDKISKVVQNFGQSVQSTGFGLLAAIVFMIVNAAVEPGFERLLAYGATVRDIVSLTKQKLGMETATRGGDEP